MGLLFVVMQVVAVTTPAHGYFLSDVERERAALVETHRTVDAAQHNFTYSVRGGASLGSYEGGYSWALLRALRNRGHKLGLREVNIDAFTGASAGSINTILGADAWLQRDDEGLEQSLLWSAWTNVGIDQLVPDLGDPDGYERALARFDATCAALPSVHGGPEERAFDGDTNGIFSRRGFDCIKRKLGSRILGSSYDSAPIRTYVGVALTQVTAERISDEARVRVGTQRSFAALAMQTRERGIEVTDATCTLDGTSMGHRIALGHGKLTREVFDLASASSAFPLVFSPVCIGTVDGEGRCSGQMVLDGGVFENEPVRLASQLAACNAPGEPHAVTLLLDPNVPNAAADNTTRLAGLEQVAQVIAESVDTSMNAELLTFQDEKETVVALARHARVFGSGESNFAAFYAHAFRRYDFYAGVYDAARMITRDRCSAESMFWNGTAPVDNCVETTMRALYEALEVGRHPDAAFVFERLWENDTLRNGSASVFYSGSRSQVIAALAEAIASSVTTKHYVPFVTKILTADGTLEQLDALAASKIYRTAVATADDEESRELTELVSDTGDWAKLRLDRMMTRLYAIENRQRTIDSVSTGASAGETLASVGQMLMVQMKPVAGVHVRLNNTIPDYTGGSVSAGLLRLLPNVFDTDIKNGGGSLRYNVIVGLGEHLGITLPVTPLVWMSDRENGGWRNFGTVGAGLNWRFNTAAVTSAEVLTNLIVWEHNARPEGFSKRWSVEAGTYLAFSKVHLAVEYGTGPAFFQKGAGLGRDFLVKIGLSDLPGLAYWGKRFADSL